MPRTEAIKPAVDCHALNLNEGWQPAPGAAAGVEQKMLSGLLDEDAGVGVRTRLIRFAPGTVVPNQFVHPYRGKVYFIEGKLTAGCDAHGEGGETFDKQSYACRPPGTAYGPFASKSGCVFFEIQYYA